MNHLLDPGYLYLRTSNIGRYRLSALLILLNLIPPLKAFELALRPLRLCKQPEVWHFYLETAGGGAYHVAGEGDMFSVKREHLFEQSFLEDRVVGRDDLSKANNAARKGLRIEISVSVVEGLADHGLRDCTAPFA